VSVCGVEACRFGRKSGANQHLGAVVSVCGVCGVCGVSGVCGVCLWEHLCLSVVLKSANLVPP
jgi:hypothetical protein